MKLLRALWALIGLWVCLRAPGVSGHTHVEIAYREGRLVLVHYDFDYGESDPAGLLLSVGPVAARRVPESAAFTNVLGPAGSTVWVLPQQENGELLWLGIGSETLDAASWVGNLELRLAGLEGPGHFALYVDDAFGRPVPWMNTRDGVDAADVMSLPLRGHLHCNWAFSAPGVYRVRLVASGTRRAGNVRIDSVPTDFFFEVVAPPPPVLSLARGAAGDWELSLRGQPGLDYVFEASADLADWVGVADLRATASATLHPLDPSVSIRRFFRARLR